jgi:myo-inositol-1(or 4)-monophosphatase
MHTPGDVRGSGLESELALVKYLAREVAEIALARCKRVRPQEKANHTFVTDLDHDLEEMIRDRLSAEYPDDLLTGEELSTTGGTGPRRWSIDPIDGTGNLVHGFPLWAVSIGLIDAGEPVLGVIVIPPLYEMFWAVKGFGAWRDGHQIECGDADAFHDQDNVCVGTNALRAIDSRTLPGRLRDLGSACCEIAFTACNRFQACTFLGEATHDIAAGAVIAAEAGCAFGTIDGRVLSPRELIASAPLATPTFVTPPRRLKALIAAARRLPPLARMP